MSVAEASALFLISAYDAVDVEVDAAESPARHLDPQSRGRVPGFIEQHHLLRPGEMATARLKYAGFMTHDWGTDQYGRRNHDRVVRLAYNLRARGFDMWIDETELTGNIDEQICDGIDNSNMVVIFMTQNYIDKVTGDNANDNCKKEFNYASQRRPRMLIPVLMEGHIRDATAWRRTIGMYLGKLLYIKMWEDGDLDGEGLERLAEALSKRAPCWRIDASPSVSAATGHAGPRFSAAPIVAPTPAQAGVAASRTARLTKLLLEHCQTAGKVGPFDKELLTREIVALAKRLFRLPSALVPSTTVATDLCQWFESHRAQLIEETPETVQELCQVVNGVGNVLLALDIDIMEACQQHADQLRQPSLSSSTSNELELLEATRAFEKAMPELYATLTRAGQLGAFSRKPEKLRKFCMANTVWMGLAF
jgi:hypothetical protein